MTVSDTSRRATKSGDPPETPTPPKGRGRFDLFVIIGLLVLTGAGLAALAAATGWQDTWDAMLRLSLAQFVFLLFLSLVNYGFRGLRWHLFARTLGLGTRIGQDLRHFVGGFAMSVTPGRVGELIRMRWIRRETGWSFERTAPLVLVDRAADLGAMALILALSLGLSATAIAGAVPLVALAVAAAVVVTHPALLGGVATLAHRLVGVFPRLFARVRAASRSLETFRDPKTMGVALALGIVGWMAEGVAFWLLLVWLGADIGFWMAVAIFVFATLAGGLTGAPGGVGGAEAAMIALLTLDGVSLDVAIAATLIIRLTTFWFAIALGAMVFPMAERRSQAARHAT
ncbi:MAG: lysylphosphatidylglycerol synthase transmembrane domain-containing protein [Pseudomonadota bacterium]